MKSRLRAQALDWVFETLPAAALITAEGVCLRSSSSHRAEVGLLPFAAEIATKYFPLTTGDHILIKEPAAGGSGGARGTLVTRMPSEKDSPGPLLATAFEWPGSAGMRCPPLPLRLNGEDNTAVLQALGEQTQPIRDEIARHENTARLWKEMQSLFFRKGTNEWIEDRRRELDQRLHEAPYGEATGEALAPSGEKVRVQILFDDKGFRFDFSGTSPGRKLFLPLAATASLIQCSLLDWMGVDPVLDSGRTALLPLLVPQGCFLQAKANEPMELGLKEGTGPLLAAFEQACHRWDRRTPRGLTNPYDLHVEMEFSAQRHCHLRIPSGSAAREGLDGESFWRQRPGQVELGLEEIETRFPLRWVRVDERHSLSGKGRFAGGNGLHLQLEIRESALLRWNGESHIARPPTEKHQSPWSCAEVRLRRGDSEEAVSSREPVQLQAGDILILLSGSGGGLL